MSAPETVVEVGLVFTGARAWVVQGYADGFEVRGWTDGESGQFRHWPAGGGWIATTEDNDVGVIGMRGCDVGAVAVPSPEAVGPVPESVVVRFCWPAEVSARMEREGDEARYEARFAEAVPERWFAVGEDAWLGVSAGGELSRVVVRAVLPAPERVRVRLPRERYAASLSAGRFLQVELEPAGVAEGWPSRLDAYRRDASYEAARGNAWLTLGGGGVFETLEVHDLVEGEAVEFDRDAPSVGDAVEGWQEWPADVGGWWWREDGRVWAAVRFTDHAAERWDRLDTLTWVGTTESGQITALVFGGVEEPVRRFSAVRGCRCGTGRAAPARSDGGSVRVAAVRGVRAGG